MKRRLVVLCDGTWNSADKPDVTNVCKLRDLVDDDRDAAIPQIVKYEQGVGTRPWERIRGGAFGVGLSRNVRECYAFLVDHYEPGDELFFFGFSRGAFTARSLGGLVRNSGILRRENRGMVNDAYKLYRSRKPEDKPSEDAATAFRARNSHPDAEITFIGVWDTVGALGIPSIRFTLPGLSKRWTFHDTTLSKYVHNAFHAISIDERRRPFVPTLWVKKQDEHGNVEEPPQEQTVEQVWFAGVHSDVGGGYMKTESDTSDIPLRWLAGRARDCGLVLKPGALDGEDVPTAGLHDSLTLFYKLMGPIDRNLTAIDGEPINASLAPSVKARHAANASYSPPGLAEWLAREAVPR
ncbi:MAG TPA: DUF2235 domain-containing protein [Solirubrobacteraceae bacterium]|nr:DUF2235 domain-containing protein [Solirubrobacteraceae bacterium]